MYRHIVFDFDGTLIDSADACFVATKRAVRELLGIEMDYEFLKRTFALPNPVWCAELGIVSPERVREMNDRIERYYTELATNNRLFDGIDEVLAALRARGISTGIVTSRSFSEMHEPLLAAIRPQFSDVITRDMVSRIKPDAEPMELYRKRAGLEKGELLFIGDTDADEGCAKNAGEDFALALWGTLMPELDAKYRLEHPMDLLKVLD